MELEEIRRLKGVRKVTVLTAYDAQTAKIMEKSGIDMILVGDSLGMVVLGYKDTKQVTMEDMVRHTEAVARGAPHTHIIGDLPINSYNTVDDAISNAGRLLAAGAHSIKLEGNKPEVVRALVAEGIPVMGHLGLLPQTAEVMKVRGKKRSEAERILADARELEELGVFSVVLECIPLDLAKHVTEAINILTIGIGAGVHCDGQVLVVNDMLGMDEGYSPKHSKNYASLNDVIGEAVRGYIDEVKAGTFPKDKHSFH
jgi:3-methyl-2-oxobutanoate hydroxymethyltransferase